MKKFTYVFALLMCLSLLKPYLALAELPDPPSVNGEACIVMDPVTGKVLYEKNAREILEPASTTKIMTAILALERGNLGDIVVTGSEPPKAEGTRIYLEVGEKLTLEQVLYGMMLNSGNDAAIAVAEHISGDVPSFVELMNQKAREIGAFDTNFVNPNGLVDEGHVTTAYDLALITRYAMNNFPKFREIVATKTMDIPWQAKEHDRSLINLNKLLWEYDGANGVKTGYTSRAGRTLVASAVRDGWQLIAVILKSDLNEIWPNAKALLDYGFDNFEPVDLVREGTKISTEKVKYAGELDIVAAQGFIDVKPKNGLAITSEVSLDALIKAPVKKGEVLGAMTFYSGSEKLGSVDLIASADVDRKLYTFWWIWVFPSLFFAVTALRIRAVIRRRRRYYNKYKSLSYNRGYRY